MKRIVLAGAVLALVSGTAAYASDEDDVTAAIQAFIAAINKGDMPAAAATHVAAPSIIDEFPPHHWEGATAFNDWLAAFGADSTARKVTDSKLAPHSAKRLTVEGDHAYVVMPTDYTFKQNGKSMAEYGTITYALDKTTAGWRIAAWSFSW